MKRPLFLRSLFVVAGALAGSAPAAGLAQPLPHGPDTCKQGFVWREAFPGDHACVTPQAREQAAADNRAAGERRRPGGGAYGPDTCRDGFVWREAHASDRVCVPPVIRSATAADNRLAASRRVAMAAPAPVPVGRVDPQCDMYAKRASRQFSLTKDIRECAVRPDGRWQDNHDAHYGWCLTASRAARAAEQDARDVWLRRCGAIVKID